MSYPPDDERYAALARYLAGECTPSETARIQRLLAEEPDRAKAMKALAGMMDRLEPAPIAPVDVDAAWGRVRDRMRLVEPPAPDPEPVIAAPVVETVIEVIEAVPEPEPLVLEAVIEVMEPAPEPEPLVLEAVVEVMEPAPEPEPLVLEAVVEVVEPAPEPEPPVVEAVIEVIEAVPEPEPPVVEAAIEEVELVPEPEAPGRRAPWWSAAVTAAARAGAALWKWVRGGR